MSDNRPVVTLTTDFGSVDGYSGIVKGVLIGLAPQVSIVDISHEVKRWDIKAAAWILANSYQYFPSGTVHLAVVDPGVGTSRRPIAIVCRSGAFVGPDNGIFSFVLDRERDAQAYTLTNADTWLKPVSATFHARDIFAPVAARLASGWQAESLGEITDMETLVRLPVPPLRSQLGCLEGEVVYVDCFGNLISNIPASMVSPGARCFLDGRALGALAVTYDSAPAGSVVVIAGSHGFIEIAMSQGPADCELNAGPGSKLKLEAGGAHFPASS